MMHSLSFMAVAPLAVHAAQSTTWPNFVLRANITQTYNSSYSAQDPRQLWHNTPVGSIGIGTDGGPLFESSTCKFPTRFGLNDHAPYTTPDFFYLYATEDTPYAPSVMAYDTNPYRVQIAQANQRDSKGRRAIMTDDCGSGSTGLYISQDEPYHLVYDNQEAHEEFGSFYACGVEGTVYGDGIFYRSADEETPEDCGELILYPECMPLSYSLTTTQGPSTVQVAHDTPGAYNATCYVNVETVDGAPNDDVSAWMLASRTSFDKVGHVSVDGPNEY